MRTGYTVIKNLFYMLFSNFVARVGSLITVVYLANILGPDGFGKLNFAAAFLGYFSVFADFGVSLLSARDLSQNREKAVEILNSTLGFKLVFSLAAFAAIALSAVFMDRDLATRKMIILYGLTIFSSGTFFLAWFFQGLERMKYLSYSFILQSFIYVFAVFAFVKSEADLIVIPALLFISQLAAVLAQFYQVKKLFPGFVLKPGFGNFREKTAKAFPVTMGHFLLIVGQSTPLVIIAFVLDDAAVGFFASAQKISVLIWEVIYTYVSVTFPALAKSFREDPEKFNRIINYSVKFASVFLMPPLLLIAVLSYSITETVYGSRFLESYWTLKIMIFLPMLMFLDALLSNALIIAHRQKTASLIKLATTVLMLVSVYFSIKPFGIAGAAFFMCLAAALNAALEYLYCRDFIKINFTESLLKPALYSSMAGGIVFYVKSLSLPLAFVLAFVFYSLTIYFFKTFSRDEIEFVKSNLRMLKSRFVDLKMES